MDDGPVVGSSSEVIPVCACWPLGFGWSSYVAQATMVSTCLGVGFEAHQLLSSERLLLPETREAVAVLLPPTTSTILWPCLSGSASRLWVRH